MAGAGEMSRKFKHEFEPVHLNTLGGEVSLTCAQIEQAGLLEILQAPGAMLTSGAVLDSLLSPGSDQFLFTQHLGQAREVKVALSGLLGRFVTRAYLTEHHGYKFYNHLTASTLTLHGGQQAKVVRKKKGDLPDWVVYKPAGRGLGVAEAKGCHDPAGPQSALGRAWAQANRIDLVSATGRLALKRYAVAVRWGVENSALAEPLIAVFDPDEVGDAVPEDVEAAALGVVRAHVANLVRRLGHSALADGIDRLRFRTGDESDSEDEDELKSTALAAVDQAPKRRLTRDGQDLGFADGLIGGVVTRAGPVRGGADLSVADQEVLARLDLGATFVGVEPSVIRAAVSGTWPELEKALTLTRLSVPDDVGTDHGGTWVRRLGDGFIAA